MQFSTIKSSKQKEKKTETLMSSHSSFVSNGSGRAEQSKNQTNASCRTRSNKKSMSKKSRDVDDRGITNLQILDKIDVKNDQ